MYAIFLESALMHVHQWVHQVRLLSGQKRWGLTHLLYNPTRYFTIVGALCIVYSMSM